MQKELIIATTSQETKIAILEDDELVEFYIERHRSQGIVGNIYKGRVTKVLPGMQSAFVDIGLERDAFLYVSDFFEDTEEYDKIVSTVEEEVIQLQEGGGRSRTSPVLPIPLPTPLPIPLPVPVLAPVAPVVEQRAEVEFAAPVAALADVAPATAVEEDRGARRPDRDRGPRPERSRDRDRRGKKPNIPSFENKTADRPDREIPEPLEVREVREPREPREVREPREPREPREEKTFGGLEPLPGESLAKYARQAAEPKKPEPRPVVVEEFVAAAVEPIQEVVPEVVQEVAPAADPAPAAEPAASEESASARISDRTDNLNFANRSSNRRPRRRGPGPADRPDGPPVVPERTDRPEPPALPVARGNGPGPKASPLISELLREGQEILVQVAKEPLGKKGARITSHIALPGRYLVYMPTVDHIGVSRKIASDEERSRLKRIIQDNRNGLPGGFIVRTASEGRSEDEFVQDLRFLGNLWSDIRSRSEKKSGPALIHRDLNPIQRMLRDQLNPDFRAIRLDNEQEFATVLDFVNKFQPALVNRVKLHLKETPIFEEFGLHVEIEKALRPKVWLKSGGYIVINQTEALVAIDVNTGKFVGKSNRLEDTIVKTNLDAVTEIVRQIRLRNLGGIIVLDFIDMEEKKNRQRVMAALEEALRADRSPSKILQFNDFGLVAITRKRTQPSLERTLCSPCSHCNGAGWTKSPETVCYEIQQEVKKMAHLLGAKEITIRVNPEVAKVLKSGQFVNTHELEEWTKKDIIVKSDPLLHDEHFDIF